MQADHEQRSEYVLHYIERLHATLTATGASVNRAYVLQCASCLITIIVSLGLARSSNLLSIAGLTLSAPPWLVVIGLSVLVAVTFAYLIGLSSHLKRIRKRITGLYVSLGYTGPQQDWGIAHPMEYPDISSVIADAGLEIKSWPLGTLLRSVNIPILIATLVVFPILAQLSVAQYLVRSFGWEWLDGLYIVFIVLATLIHCFAFIVVSLQ